MVIMYVPQLVLMEMILGLMELELLVEAVAAQKVLMRLMEHLVGELVEI